VILEKNEEKKKVERFLLVTSSAIALLPLSAHQIQHNL